MKGLAKLASYPLSKHHTKVAKESPPYLHSGELLEFNVENDKALERERKYKERLRRLKERRTNERQ